MDDRATVEGLRRGDPAAFDAAFDRWRDPVFGFLVRLCGRREVADELVQETFLRLAAHAQTLRPDTSLRAWLFTVARNLWRSQQRWAWLDARRLGELAGRAFGQEPTPHDLATAAELGGRLERALAALPDANREVALLVLVEGFTPAEASVVLGIRADALRQRLARARQVLGLEVEP